MPSLARRRHYARLAAPERHASVRLAEPAPSSPPTSAEVCRANGWTQGDRIRDVATSLDIVLCITAIGDEKVFVRTRTGFEVPWDFRVGKWLKMHECAACGRDCDGSVGIHQDGPGTGPKVPLCRTHAHQAEHVDPAPVWTAIKARRVAAGEAVGA